MPQGNDIPAHPKRPIGVTVAACAFVALAVDVGVVVAMSRPFGSVQAVLAGVGGLHLLVGIGLFAGRRGSRLLGILVGGGDAVLVTAVAYSLGIFCPFGPEWPQATLVLALVAELGLVRLLTTARARAYTDFPRRRYRPVGIVRRLLHSVGTLAGAGGMALAFFMVLPVMQSISQPPRPDLLVQSVEVADVPPPPPMEEPEEVPPEPQEKPPELTEQKPMTLEQTELVLNPGGIGGFGIGEDLMPDISGMAGRAGNAAEEIADAFELDQKPRVIYQTSPVTDRKVREKAPGTVYVIFIVDERGRVTRPKVQRSSDPVFEAPALTAVKQWKFEPGKRGGEPVKFRMRVPIVFPETR